MSIHESFGTGASGHPNDQPQSAQSPVLAHDEHNPQLIPERKVAFRVNTNNTIWSYELEQTGEGTRVVESRHAENGIKPTSNFLVSTLFGGVPNFERELVDGMNASLARIKAAAENG
jgi:hypothetical protein